MKSKCKFKPIVISMEIGKSICIKEPMGSRGLEGYELDKEYKYELLESKKEQYYKVFINDEDYSICTKSTFFIYFKII